MGVVMIDVTKLTTKQYFQWPLGGGVTIIYSQIIPPGKCLLLEQADVGQGAGASGAYNQRASLARIYHVPAPYTGFWRHNFACAPHSVNSTPLLAWSGQLLLFAGMQLSARVDTLWAGEMVTCVFSGWIFDESELGQFGIMPTPVCNINGMGAMGMTFSHHPEREGRIISGWRLRLAKLRAKLKL